MPHQYQGCPAPKSMSPLEARAYYKKEHEALINSHHGRVIYTDGGCTKRSDKNGYDGAFACVDTFFDRGEQTSLVAYAGFSAHATNIKAEMLGVFHALLLLRGDPGLIMTDSEFAVRSIYEYRQTWTYHPAKNIFTSRSAGKDIANSDLWRFIFHELDGNSNVRVQWVKAHSGNYYNHVADEICSSVLRHRKTNVPSLAGRTKSFPELFP